MILPIVTPDDGNEDNTATEPAEKTLPGFESTLPAPESDLSGYDRNLPLLDSTKPLVRADEALYQIGTAHALMMDDSFKIKSSRRWLVVMLCVILGLIIAAYVGLSIFFMNHFTFNSTVNGIPVALKTVEEVNDNLAQEITRYSLDIKAREGQQATIIGSQIELTYVDDGGIQDALTQQIPWFWPLAFFSDSMSNIQQVSVNFDQRKLETTLATFSFMDEEQMRPPVDATLGFEGNLYVITGYDEGTTLDTQKTTRAVAEAISSGMSELKLEDLEVYLKPAIPADDPALVEVCDRFNQYVPFKITYILGDSIEVLDGYTTINWVNTEGEGPYTLDPNAVVAWVADLASRYDTLASPRSIISGYGEQKNVQGGTFGWVLDQDSEYWAIMYAAEQHLGEAREPYWVSWGESFGENDWGSTYLEVDITHQHMWYYVDGVCVLETDVVTGNPNKKDCATPEGVWYVFLKTTNFVTRGPPLPEGGYEWEVPVTYWMPFTPSGCGFHDASWQPSFGHDYYLWRGSHGCINMPPSLAAELYSMLEPGTPVITHY